MEYPESDEEFEEFIDRTEHEISRCRIPKSEKRNLYYLLDKVDEAYERMEDLFDKEEPFMYLGDALEIMQEAIKNGKKDFYDDIAKRIIQNSQNVCKKLQEIRDTLDLVKSDRNLLEQKATADLVLREMRKQGSN